MVVSDVEVNGRDARFSHDGGQELTVTPRHALKRGHKFTVEVEYGGHAAADCRSGRFA